MAINDDNKTGFGGTGSIDDRAKAWLAAQGATTGSLPDRWNTYLRGIGYTGSFNDMYAKWIANGKFNHIPMETGVAIIPAMTANVDQGFTLSTDMGEFGSLPLWECFDGVTNSATSYWLSNASTSSGEIVIQLDDTYPVYSYDVGSGPTVARMPRDWTFEGSNNGSSWTVLDTQTGVIADFAYDFDNYRLSSPVEYSYFRLNITDNNGDSRTAADRIQLYS
jgi:hypothetical protein